MQRRSVVFPLPDRPMIITASRVLDLEVHAAQNVVLAEVLVQPLDAMITSPTCAGGFGASAASA